MRKIAIIVIILLLTGCYAQDIQGLSKECVQECERYYSDTAIISDLLGAELPQPHKVICSQPLDCSAKYKIKDTSLNLYYFKNETTEEFYKNFNHKVMHISNCTGTLCSKLNGFHYVGPPRGLEVTCKNNLVIIKNKSETANYTINCDKFKTQNKYLQRTWVCDFNDLVKASCS